MIERAGPAAGLTDHQVAFADARHAQAVRAAERREFRHAARLMREVVAVTPDDAEAWAELGAALLCSVRPDEPGYAERHADAKRALRRALRLDPDHAGATSYFALACGHEGRRAACLRLHRRAVALDGTEATALGWLANALVDYGDLRGDLDAAEDVYGRATMQRPSNLEVAGGLARLLLLRGRHAEAWRVLDRATLWAPDEHWRTPMWGNWPGAPEPAPGRDEIHLDFPQGLGDQLFALRYLPDVARAGWRPVYLCTPPLTRLLRASPIGARVVEVARRGDVLRRRAGACLVQILLPWRFRTDPAAPPPPASIRPDPEDVRRWASRVGDGPALRVGLIWGSTDPWRSLRLADLAPLSTVSGVRFYGLQVGPHASQAADPPAGMAFEDLSGEIADFADLAAAMVNLDLIVTVDTGPAHLAGSLGLPTWVLIPTHLAWFWGLEGERVTWYPSLRLFRQSIPGDWSAPVARVADELRRRAATHRFGGMSIIGVKGTDERGALVSWLPERMATTPTTAAGD